MQKSHIHSITKNNGERCHAFLPIIDERQRDLWYLNENATSYRCSPYIVHGNECMCEDCLYEVFRYMLDQDIVYEEWASLYGDRNATVRAILKSIENSRKLTGPVNDENMPKFSILKKLVKIVGSLTDIERAYIRMSLGDAPDPDKWRSDVAASIRENAVSHVHVRMKINKERIDEYIVNKDDDILNMSNIQKIECKRRTCPIGTSFSLLKCRW